jgi:hypothetical protein
MNEHFLIGFVKAAAAAGVPEDQIAALAQSQGLQPEVGEAAAMGDAVQHEPSPEELEHLISQLSPEELQQLEAALEQPQHAEQPELHELAQAIGGHLDNNPEVAAMAQQTQDLAKQSSLNLVKSANYIEGFLDQAVRRGVSVKEAVDLYDAAFTQTFNHFKASELKGDQAELDKNKNGKIDAADLKELREAKEDKKEETEVDQKTAAYYEGVLERAREYGLSDSQTIDLLKSAAPLLSAVERGVQRAASMSKGTAATAATAAKAVAEKEKALGFFDEMLEKAKQHKGALALGAGGTAAGYLIGKPADKE